MLQEAIEAHERAKRDNPGCRVWLVNGSHENWRIDIEENENPSLPAWERISCPRQFLSGELFGEKIGKEEVIDLLKEHRPDLIQEDEDLDYLIRENDTNWLPINGIEGLVIVSYTSEM